MRPTSLNLESNPMKTKAAVAWKSGAPLTIETVDLQGPKFGEVLSRSRPPAFAIPTTTRSAAPTPRASSRPYWAMKARASWWTWGRA